MGWRHSLDRPPIPQENMRSHPARSFLTFLCTLFALSAGSGCATYTAVKIPGPVRDETIALGVHRKDVEVVLQSAPVNEYHDGGGTTARYQYKDGPHEASKGRVVLYIAGDVFTLFLSELVFWPIEAYASKQTQRIATAHYDESNMLVGWSIDRPGGERLVTLGDVAAAPAPEAAVASEPRPAGRSRSKTAR